MRTFALTLALALAPTVAGFHQQAVAAEHALAPEISLNDLKKSVATKNSTIIDANSLDMYKDGHIPGAVSYAKDSANLASKLPKDKGAPIIAYCGGPMCTAWEDAAKAAKSLGYTNIKHFKGGIKGWKDAGEKTDKGA